MHQNLYFQKFNYFEIGIGMNESLVGIPIHTKKIFLAYTTTVNQLPVVQKF